MDLDFLVLVNVDIDNHLVLLAQVRNLNDLARRLAEALAGVIFLDEELDAVGDVGGHLAARLETQTLNDVFLLATLHAVVVHLRHTGLLTQVEYQPRLVVVDFLYLNLDLGEQALTPETLGGTLDVLAGDIHLLTDSKSRIADDDVRVIVVHTLDADAGNLISRWRAGKHDLGIIDGIIDYACLLSLALDGSGCCHRQQTEERVLDILCV